MKKFLLSSLLAFLCLGAKSQHTTFDAPGNLNPILPGYFADPTIRKFGDTYYIYATTDGTGNGYGPAQVWVSKDFCNWKNVVMNWPTTEVVWAPDVVQQSNGKYRYFYCEPCVVHVGESDSPLGPWHNILGRDNAVMVPDRFVHNAITLDPQLFRDDDGQEYLYFGTWGIYTDFGCGVAKLNPNWKEGDGQETFFSDKKLILNTEIKDFFEAPFVFKKDGIYYFTYSSGSCHDDTYRVQYATATHPMGPYTYKGCILKTNADGTVHGPGHHSILVDGKDYYIVYHRHNNPHSLHGFHRQVCIDKLTFDAEGNINIINPTHEGPLVGGEFPLAKPSKKMPKNLAYGAMVTASSYYSDAFLPKFATDDNNGTLWRAAHTPWDNATSHNPESLTIDLGKPMAFNQIWTQFENATFFYQYRIDTSVNGFEWTLFADRTKNTQAGSPMIDELSATMTGAQSVTARYIRITITDTQKNGHFAAIWNVKVYNATKKHNPKDLLPNTDGMDLAAVEKGYPWLHTLDVSREAREAMNSHKGVVMELNADQYKETGKLPDFIQQEGLDPIVEPKSGKYGFYFNGQQPMHTSIQLPQSMSYNSPYTIQAWVLNTSVSPIETVVSLSAAHNDLGTTELRNGSDRSNGLIAHNGSFENSGASRAINEGEGKWQHWVVTYDGYMERVYLNGQLLQKKDNFIMIRPQGTITIGASADGSNPFSGYLHSLKVLNYSLTADEVIKAYNEPSIRICEDIFFTKPTLRIARLSPEHISIQISDDKGSPLRTGLLRYQYGDSKPTDNANMVMTVPANAKNVSVKILKDTGEELYNLQEALPIDKTKYTLVEKKEVQRLSNTLGEHFNDNPIENGMTTLTEANGDFIITARFVDIDGSKRHSTPAYNEGGLIMSDGQNSVHIGVFPAYDCGNMLTHLTRHGRPQYPNGKGWHYDPWMQLQRNGNKVHARTSLDGIHWTENPGSPITLRSVTPVKVGLYQTTYNNNTSWVEMDSVQIYTRTKTE